jgi:hypothetical protein
VNQADRAGSSSGLRLAVSLAAVGISRAAATIPASRPIRIMM